jgi:hypothetical protein
LSPDIYWSTQHNLQHDVNIDYPHIHSNTLKKAKHQRAGVWSTHRLPRAFHAPGFIAIAANCLITSGESPSNTWSNPPQSASVCIISTFKFGAEKGGCCHNNPVIVLPGPVALTQLR